MVRQRSAKPSLAGSIPAVASISVPANFNFPATVVSHGWYRLAPFRWDGRVLLRAEALADGVAELELTFEKRELLVRGAPLTDELRARLTRMFQLHVDTADFVERARHSPAHAWVAASGFGRLLCGSTLWEDVVKIIATTNTTWRQTVRMTELLVEKCGARSPQGFAAFPTPAEVARFSEAELQQDCRLGYRAKSIHTLARGIIDGKFLGDAQNAELRGTGGTRRSEELFREYQQLPGIGPYGAAHLLAMDGRHDFIAVDTEFRRFVRETYHGGRRMSDATMLRRYAKWGRWKYLAYWSELWKSVAEGLQPMQNEDE